MPTRSGGSTSHFLLLCVSCGLLGSGKKKLQNFEGEVSAAYNPTLIIIFFLAQGGV